VTQLTDMAPDADGILLSAEQQQLEQSFSRFFRSNCDSGRVRDSEPIGFSPELWHAAKGIDVPGMALDASLLECALLCEVAGQHLAPIPVVESVVVARLLGEVFDAPVGIVLPGSDLVPAGAVASTVIGLVAGDLAVETAPTPSPHLANIASAPLAWRRLDVDRTVVARGSEARERYERAVDEWRVLTAAALVGVGVAALDLAVDYAKNRVQFGAVIGSYQAIQQRLADVATELDGARLLVRSAAASQRPVAASMAFAFASQTAQRAAAFGVHVHGGYGVSLEYDAQLCFRRAKGWPLMLGDPEREIQRIGDLLWGGAS
jgi:Acyl-CoA dehydrogenase, C-terminal domain